MAISKIILNGEVQMDVTSDTVTAGSMLSGTIATKNDGTKATGTIATKSSTDLTVSGATVTAPAGYYSANASKSVANGSVTAPSSISGTSATVSTGTNTLTLTKTVSVTPNVTTAGYISSGTAGNSSVSLTASVTTKAAATITPSTSAQEIAAGTYLTGKQTIAAMPTGTAGTPTATKGTVSNNQISITPSVTNMTGYISGGTKTGTAVTVSASELVSGTLYCDDDGSWDVTNAQTFVVDAGTVNNPTATKGAVTNHSVTVTPSVSHTLGWISSGTKTGTAVTVSASELVSGTYTVDSSGTKNVTNYASASVPAGTAGTPSASKGAVSNHSVSVTPSVTNQTGWITGSTKTGTAVTVSVSELVSGTLSITENGTGINVTNYASVDVNVSGGATNLVQGTFTTSTTGGTYTLNIPYTGSGYPLMVDICVTNVESNTNWQNLIQANAVEHIVLSKMWPQSAPTYATGTSNSADFTIGGIRYKNSSSDPAVYNHTYATGYLFSGSSPSSSAGEFIKMSNATRMKIKVYYNSYSLGRDIDYTYTILYSE